MAHTITVRGMSCEGCETAVEDALTVVSGVNSVEVKRQSSSVRIEGTADLDGLIIAIEDAGYEVPESNAYLPGSRD